MLIAETIEAARYQILRLIKEQGYKQPIDKGEFEKTSVFRIQAQPLAIRILHPMNMFDKSDKISIHEINSYAISLLDPEKNKEADYTYGERIAEQFNNIIAMLSHTPNTNQAIIEIAKPSDGKLKHMPCLRILHFVAYEGKLNMTVFFRSNDIKEAFRLNMYGLAKLFDTVATISGHETGEITYFSSGAHYYVH